MLRASHSAASNMGVLPGFHSFKILSGFSQNVKLYIFVYERTTNYRWLWLKTTHIYLPFTKGVGTGAFSSLCLAIWSVMLCLASWSIAILPASVTDVMLPVLYYPCRSSIFWSSAFQSGLQKGVWDICLVTIFWCVQKAASLFESFCQWQYSKWRADLCDSNFVQEHETLHLILNTLINMIKMVLLRYRV